MSIDSRFEKFMLSLPSIESIDSIELSEELRKEKKADYLGMGRKIIFEQKCITQEQSQKIELELEQYVNDENYPVFYGERDFNLVIKDLPNSEDIKNRVFVRITKLLESYLSQACKQIESSKNIFNLDNSVGVLVILNEKIKILSPDLVVYRFQQRMKEKKDDDFRFNTIDYIIFISETHEINGNPVVIILEGPNAAKNPAEINEYLNYIANGWSQFNGRNTMKIGNARDLFINLEEKEEPKSNSLTRTDERKLWYRKNRYMKDWSDDKVLQAAVDHMNKIMPFILKNGPKLPVDKLGELMLAFGDFIEESNMRGLDLKGLNNLFTDK